MPDPEDDIDVIPIEEIPSVGIAGISMYFYAMIQLTSSQKKFLAEHLKLVVVTKK